MEVMKEKLMEDQQVAEKTIPVFTVLKNGAILKNIFVVNSRDFSSPERNGDAVSDDAEVEEILRVGRHPDCDILLTHPSISRFHLEICSIPSRQKLFVTDLSSVHGTWVTDQKVEPGACVEVKEGDVIRIGGSTRIYRLHWIPLSRAYDIDNPFVPSLDASKAMEQEEENRTLEAVNLEVAHQSLAKTASGDEGDLHLDVTSEGTGSSLPSEDEDTFTTTEEISLSLASPSVLALAKDSVNTQNLQFSEDLHCSPKWDLDVEEAAAEKPSKQQSGGYPEVFGCSELEFEAEAEGCDVRGDGVLHLNVISERMKSLVPNKDEDPYLAVKEPSSLPVPRDSTETEKLQFTEDVQASPELAISIIEANAENPSICCFPSTGQIAGCMGMEALGSAFELAVEVEVHSLRLEVNGETEFVTKQVMEASAESLTKAEIQSHEDNGKTEVSSQAMAVSANSFPQTEPTLGILTEDGLLGSELQSEVAIETDSENLHQKGNGETEFVTTQLMEAPAQPLTKAEIRRHKDNRETEVSSQYLAISPISFPQTEPALEILTEDALALLGSGFQSEVAIATDSGDIGFVTTQVMEASAEPLTKDVTESREDNGETEVSRKVMAVSPSSVPLDEAALEFLTEDAQGLLGYELQSEVAIETDTENLHQKSNGETKFSSRQASAVSDCLFAGNECLSSINTEDIRTLCSSWQPLPESEVGAPSESESFEEPFLSFRQIWSEVNPAGYQNQKSGMNRETEKKIDEGSSSCLSEELEKSGTRSCLLTPIQELKTEMSIGSGRSEEYYSLRDIEGEGDTDKGMTILSTLAAETFEDTKPVGELPSDYTGSQENQTPQTPVVRDDVLAEINSSISSSRTLRTCNIWSRRGKDASILQLRTNKSKEKQKKIGNQPKAQLQRKQTLSDKSISLTVHDGGEYLLEPEIFTPDKENLTPSSHMLKRLQDIGDIKDSKSSSKLSRSSCSSKIPSVIDLVTLEAFAEPETFTPDKENLTPNSHMLKRLREVGGIKDTKGSSSKSTRKPFSDSLLEENVMVKQKLDLNCVSSKSKVKNEEMALKNKAERTPFQPLLEKSSAQSQSYIEASSTASVRNNISRGMRSPSLLSDGKSKMKWSIVLDTSSLLDKDSRKPLNLLQGLKGTHLVVPRTVIRELNEVKRTRSLFFGRRTEIASSALDWIEECKVNTKWWIQMQSLSEETKATAPTPPVTPQSTGSAAFPFSFQWNSNVPEIDSPTSQDQVLDCALLYRNINSDEKLVLLSNDATLKVKAMAEGVICETPHEFYESLVNPFSDRFMWKESSARGRTWSHLDDVVLRERYNDRACFPYRNKSTYTNGGRRGESGAAAKGLKLILLHNSHYGHNR